MSRETALRELLPLVQVAEALAQKYDVVVTNPPYMGSQWYGCKAGKLFKEILSRLEIRYEYGFYGKNVSYV